MGRWSRMCWIFGASTVLLLLVRFTKWDAISINEVDERYERIKRQHPQFPLLDRKRLPDPSLKTILLWNSWFHMDSAFFFGIGGRELFAKAGCPETRCYVSNDRFLMPPDEYDSILFFFPMLRDVPFTYSRRPAQSYVFVNEEPPTLYTQIYLTQLNGFFNLTMSFRSDSDIVWPYGTVERLEQNKPSLNIVTNNPAKGKTKLVAWFVSNCQSESLREKYVQTMKKYIDVDVYGKCGDHVCWVGEQDECYNILERDYKFYLAFENSFCRDYVTEKFFKLLDLRVVPVVYGGANYSRIAPPGSYIDATQMGAKRLAELLLKIDQDDNLYAKFFQWKSSYRIIHDHQSMARRAFCQLCETLHQDHNSRAQVYDNFDGWWDRENHCHSSGMFVIPFTSFSFHEVVVSDFGPRKLDSHTKINHSVIDL